MTAFTVDQELTMHFEEIAADQAAAIYFLADPWEAHLAALELLELAALYD
jgi:hypothetical protein